MLARVRHQLLLRFPLWVVVVVALFVAACSDRTSLLVEVRSSLVIPDQVDRLYIQVTGTTTGQSVEGTYDVTSDWPHTVSIRPGEMESGEVRVTVIARRGDTYVAHRVVPAVFVQGVQNVVPVEIYPACAARPEPCPLNLDCDQNGFCVGQVIMRDAGPMDGGPPDAGPMDAGCSDNTQCADELDCTVDTCSNGGCVHTPNDAFCAFGVCDEDDCPPRTCETQEECTDNVFCNGVEECVDGMCALGQPVDCNDSDACTMDTCVEMARECTHVTVDADNDTFGDMACPAAGGVPNTDCNDLNDQVNPDAVDDCNGIDDDCNATCDDSFQCCRGRSGPCQTSCDAANGTSMTGTQLCGNSCAWGACNPPPEQCNAIDDDCENGADDIFECVLGDVENCTTSCGSIGTHTCVDGCTWGDCMPPAETCNGADDNCNGVPDDGPGLQCVQNIGVPCQTMCDLPLGATTGTRACSPTCQLSPTCTAPPEAGCNGRDDNCNGQTDESSECVVPPGGPAPTQGCTLGCGRPGTQTCVASTCAWGVCTAAEICNGIDDNCNGTIDEGFTCIPNSQRDCTTSCTTTGTQTCTNLCAWGTCVAPAEICNGRDDNCVAGCDENFACCANTTSSCTTTCGSTGTQSCSGACGATCSPPAEVCDGDDDNCDDVCDNGAGMQCCRGRVDAPCPTTCGSTGTRDCTNSCTWTECTPPAEICNNGTDDDCVDGIDNGFQCVAGSTHVCQTTCDIPLGTTTGTRICDGACTLPSFCTPPNETCNGRDDNCDGTIDEGCGACAGCSGATGVSLPGGRFNVVLGAHAQTPSCAAGTTGSEGYLTFTLTETSDVFITTHHALTVDTVIEVRECMCNGAAVTGGCNDNADARNTSVVRLTNLDAGTYNVIIDTKTMMSATIPVDIYINPPAPASDRCGNPSFIAAGTTSLSGTTCGFASDYKPVATSACQYQESGNSNDRVFYFVIPTARTVIFSGCNVGTYDQAFFMRRICSDATATAQAACNDDGCNGGQGCLSESRRSSLGISNLAAGLYYVFPDGDFYGSCPACGDFGFSVSGL